MLRHHTGRRRHGANYSNPAPMYSPPPVNHHEYNHLNMADIHSWHGSETSSSIDVPHHMETRKRRFNQPFLYAEKRQCFDSAPPPYDMSPAQVPVSPRRHFPEVGEPMRAAEHGDPRFPMQLRPAVPPPSDSHSWLQSCSTDRLSSEMLELFEACQQQSSDLVWKEVCRVQLQEDIRRLYPVARLYLTGSSMNGLGCRSSDADLCLVIEARKKHDVVAALSELQKLFRTLSYIVKATVIRAKVPILKFKERSSGLEFDLNINNTVGIRNTFLLRSYAFADLRVRPLILVIKKWARHMKINDASQGTLSSYSLVLMTLHYLQKRLPMDQIPEEAKRVPPFASKNPSSLGKLFIGFLRYYSTEFRWDQQVISVRLAKAFPTTSSTVWKNKFICVEEPFERRNVAQAVHKKIKFDLITAQFEKSYRIVQSHGNLNSILPLRDIINKEVSHS
ncbi:poly(A) RNA polymerase GLD2 isoform X2 [Gouania willdenowi]|uniref:poly(A) RNA polymerase GLD2 isoform X2 n=1 Tax=Gouania willdenowi TaxID=441366 RepID=UPI0010552018|nr:poly(A) RNA polymerase GLD2 isoform X2 [Gouania willdenowi]